MCKNKTHFGLFFFFWEIFQKEGFIFIMSLSKLNNCHLQSDSIIPVNHWSEVKEWIDSYPLQQRMNSVG